VSQLYGLFAGIFVCLPTWAALTYASTQVGLLVGLFLVTFFIVTTVYVNGDEMTERHKTLSRSLSDMEIIFFDQLKLLESKIEAVQESTPPVRHNAFGFDAPSGDLDKMIDMVERILNEHEREGHGNPANR
jgi:hypothetical protein